MSRFGFRAATIALSLALLGGGVASADPGNPTLVGGQDQTNASNSALINPNASVQLSIHKLLGAPIGTPPNGVELDPATLGGRLPLEKIDFDVYKVNGVDLLNNAGWETAALFAGRVVSQSDLTNGFTVGVAPNQTTITFTKVRTVRTNASGLATFTQATGVGLYWVSENLTTSGDPCTVNGVATRCAKNGAADVDVKSITAAKPFFVTLPMTNPTTLNTWMYDVNVYPKNQSDWITKSVVDKGIMLGEYNPPPGGGSRQVLYTITSSITPGLTGPKMGSYEIYDEVPGFLLGGGVASVKIIHADAADGEQLLVKGQWPDLDADYWVKVNTGLNSRKAEITFQDSGLVKLAAAKAANPNAQVVTTLSSGTTMIRDYSAPYANGVFRNQAGFIPNRAWEIANPGARILSNEVLSKYGRTYVKKLDPNVLAPAVQPDFSGTEFKIYRDPTPGDGICSEADVSGDPLQTGLVANNWLDGVIIPPNDERYNRISFEGLQASNWHDGVEIPAAQKAGNWVTYCVVETKAISGYTLNAGAFVAEIVASASDTVPPSVTLMVNNQRANLGNNLPLTGGAGAATLGVVGLLLIGGGLAYYVFVRRRRVE